MQIAARTAAWTGDGGDSIPAIWIGSGTSYFDSEVPFGDGRVVVDVQFYRKTAPTAGQYIFGGATGGNRFDACVYTGTFWYVGYGSNSFNCYFTSGGAMLYNAINRTSYDVDYVNKKISFSANGHTFINGSSFGFSSASFSPYIGARFTRSNPAEPAHDVGIISVDIEKNGTPFRRYRPRVENGVVGLFDEVNGQFHAPLTGASNLTYIENITKDGVVL